ncbi:SRPBCC family protein [Paraburkholderia sp. DHOC27]|uniref:SRPBCC family protein n=1 Tax=Paraburkholderia sp. DHOC27 TaxID=2303330 RepID=UPI000E3D82E7|nr:SRPBCC family protein [Paraburkholderia sp. DHOC27]RFU44578.1 carbon monoxide dehydrogenase [Paraburkholderia sp. DHOC27]
MKVVLEKVFPLGASADSAWQLLQDIESVAGCMPGAKITERVDATHYKGTITVRLGPATMAFKGVIEVLALDSGQRSLHLVGKGEDATGTSAASMDLHAAIQTAGDACELTGKSEVTMSGKAAALGGRLMGPVADQMLKQFVANFAKRLGELQAQQAQQDLQTQPTQQTDDAPEPQQTGQQARQPVDAPLRSASAAAQQPPSTVNNDAPQSELNGFALAWAILRDWLRGLFSHKTA